MPLNIAAKIRSSMSTKVALIVALPVLLFLGNHYQAHYREDKKLLYHNTEMQLIRIAEVLKGPVETFILQKNEAGLNHLIDETSKGIDIDLIAVYDRQGGVVSSNKKQWIGKHMKDMLPAEITENDVAAIRKAFLGGYFAYYDPDDEQYCLAMPLSTGRTAAGALHVSLNVGTLNSEIRKTATNIFLDSLYVLFVTIFVIYMFFHFLLIRRLKSVSRAAMKLAAGDVTARTDAAGKDEVGELAMSFNVLAEEMTKWRTSHEEMVAHRVKELSALYSVAESISRSLELQSVLPKALDSVLDTMGENKGVVVLVSEEGDMLTLMAHRGLSTEAVRQITKGGHGCAGDVILKNKPIRLSGIEDGAQGIPGLEQENVGSALGVPISARGLALGAIVVYSEKKGMFSERDEALLETIGNQIGVAVENARLYEKTLELAQSDGLTGVANRRHLMEVVKREIDRAGRYAAPLSALMLDLDKFKHFNDTYGHLKGDELLREFASMVKTNIRSLDTPGRYGGEEFAVVLPNTDLKGAIIIAERLRKSTEVLKIPVGEGASAGATVSIGIAEYSAGESIENFLAAADAALYRAKQGGRNRAAW